jgi:hypothetical protein
MRIIEIKIVYNSKIEKYLTLLVLFFTGGCVHPPVAFNLFGWRRHQPIRKISFGSI